MSEPSPLAPLVAALRGLVGWLEEAGVPGLVIGGVAASIVGRPRATRDVDALVWVDRSALDSFVAIGNEYGFRPRVPDAVEFARESNVLLLVHEESTIEVDVAIGGLPFEREAIEHGHHTTLGDFAIPIPRPEDLVVMKAIAHRPRDTADIEAILAAQPNLDRERVRTIVREFAEATAMPDLSADLEATFARIPPRDQ